MALNPGFERYEGSAFFGYDMEGEGYEVIVVIGRNLIEIRDLQDKPLSQWIPGTYRCNEESIPMRAYFHGDEWLAPQDVELQNVLDRFVKPAGEIAEAQKRKRSWGWLWAIFIFALICVISYFALRPLTKQLLSPAIRESLDERIMAHLESEYEICNPSLNEVTHEKIRAKYDGAEFEVFTNLAQNYARMPTGRLAINAEFAQNLDDVDTLVALLNLAEVRNLEQDPASEMISHFPIQSRVQFLANARASDEDLELAWEDYAREERFDVSLLSAIDQPLGDYQNLSLKIGWPESGYIDEPSGVILSDEEWLSLFTFCEVE